jgi:hypothetical protein
MVAESAKLLPSDNFPIICSANRPMEGRPMTIRPHREEVIETMLRQGATYREIGERLGISRERVRQIEMSRKRRVRPAWAQGLSPRTWNAVRRAAWDKELTPAQMRWAMPPCFVMTLDMLAGFTRRDLAALPNFGPKTICEIEATLADNGLALNP